MVLKHRVPDILDPVRLAFGDRANNPSSKVAEQRQPWQPQPHPAVLYCTAGSDARLRAAFAMEGPQMA